LEDREKKPNTNTTPRAFLLPILASLRSHPTPLAHFTQIFLPMIDQLTNLATGPGSNPSNEKAWSVLADQHWYTLPVYCSNPPDLSNTFGRELGERLTTEMYANPTLRPPILRALKNVVEPQTQDQNLGEENESEMEESKKNLRYLRGQAKHWFAVLFNVFAGVERGEPAQVGQVQRGEASWQARIGVCWGTLTPPFPGSEPAPTDPSSKKRMAK